MDMLHKIALYYLYPVIICFVKVKTSCFKLIKLKLKKLLFRALTLSKKIFIINNKSFIYSCFANYLKSRKRSNISNFQSKLNNGFTLLELIVTVTVLAIIIAIAAPAVLRQLASMEAKRIKNQLTTTLTIAKAESRIRRQNLLVCLSNTGGTCHRDSDRKILLFIDSNNNKHFDAQTDLLLSEQVLNPKYSKLHLRVGNNRHYTKFWGDSGQPRGHFGHIKYCPTSIYNKEMYQISFNQIGIIKYKPNSTHDTECE